MKTFTNRLILEERVRGSSSSLALSLAVILGPNDYGKSPFKTATVMISLRCILKASFNADQGTTPLNSDAKNAAFHHKVTEKLGVLAAQEGREND